MFFDTELTEKIGSSTTYKKAKDSGKSLEFHFCPTCGSAVFWKPYFRPGLTAVALGCFDSTLGLKPSQTVYDEYRHAWVAVTVDELSK
ncbi:glutathione-dependent formaldehyde-activating protein [Rhizobium grahamii CCGE 502]|uniref:Glutathione-dependent formaldehyde-activating protein n=1 Tax=Rhizobium grahamii CCGE 502 TaxID=990285 RepID=S3HGN5_9HYPH|nr:glutathione-dependent formaldehyde-activating protein [Rhizobium grahamii CCGE 502]